MDLWASATETCWVASNDGTDCRLRGASLVARIHDKSTEGLMTFH